MLSFNTYVQKNIIIRKRNFGFETSYIEEYEYDARGFAQEERQAVPEDLIKCTMCSALFCNKKAYNVHNSYHQPDDLYVTSERQRRQTVTKIDQDFDIRRVEAVADKYMPRPNVPKRPVSHWRKVNCNFTSLHSFSLYCEVERAATCVTRNV